MSEQVLEPKSEAFALRIVRLHKHLRKHGESVMSKQILRSGTIVGANVAEAQYAQSRADFTTKLAIAPKEAAETRYWLKPLSASGYLADTASSRSLKEERDELIRLLAASAKTLKGIS